MTLKNVLKNGVSVITLTAAFTFLPGVLQSTLQQGFGVDVTVSGVAHAQTAECIAKAKSGKKDKPRRLPAISPKLFKKMGPANDAISPEEDKKTGVRPEPRFKDGLAVLKKLLKRCDKCNKYELSQMYNLAAYASYSLNKTDDAINYYRKVYEQTPDLPLALEQQSLYTVAQLLMTQEKFSESLSTFKKWEKTCPKRINAEYYFMLGQIYYQKGDKKSSLSNVERAIKMVEAKVAPKNVPKEGWYRLQMALYVDRENYKMAVKIMEKVVAHYSKLSNWSQLAGLYGLIDKPDDQRAILDSIGVMGLLTKKADARNLAYAYLEEDVPYLSSKVFKKALKNKVLERDVKNLEVYAAALRSAGEVKDAIVIMEEAAKKSDKGQLYANLAAVYLDGDQFSKAISAGKKALQKKGLRSEAEVIMYIGQAQLYSEQYKSAISSFRKIRKDERFGRYIPGLIKYAQKEIDRAAQLAKNKKEVGEA